jgi:1-deoxy-D-xylulose-5-phosphate reductoisomerase
LEFFQPDPRRYPCLGLARMALEEGGTMPAVLNAADEILVGAFLDGRIRFSQISRLLQRVCEAGRKVSSPNLDQILEADQWARRKAAELVAARA